VDFRQPYLSQQLIAYIGSKRALLPFLHEVFASLVPEPRRARFLDPFAGTGAVSRLARVMRFRVAANDWEVYSRVINSCHLGLTPAGMTRLFAARGGAEAVLASLNALSRPRDADAYISLHYAPPRTEDADWRTHRLFYTRENALRIDAMRSMIEEMYPGQSGDPDVAMEKDVLVASLLYQAATHTNTSGVFKACHRGFGGHGRDALRRIMAPVRLLPPVLMDGPAAEVRCEEAAAFLAGRTAELCYLDPPYAVHQYGSNYFMLTSIALWDRPPVSSARGVDGRFRRKAGIREDWVGTRSAFCSARTAAAAMRATVRAADCRWLVVSYSDEGVIGLEELCDTLAAEGALSIRSRGYVKYPGGKQSLTRATRNQELAIVVQRGVRRSARPADRLLGEVRLARLMGGSFHPGRIRAAFRTEGAGIVPEDGPARALPMDRFWRFPRAAPLPSFRSRDAAETFAARLSACAVADVREEISVLVDLAREEEPGPARDRLLRETLRLLNKLAHRKYGAVFHHALAGLRGAGLAPAGSAFARGLEAVEARARVRFSASV